MKERIDLTEINENLHAFGDFIRASRTKAGKTAKVLAEEIGISKSVIISCEHHLTFIPEEKLPAVAQALGISLEKLVEKRKLSSNAREAEKNGMKNKYSTADNSMGEFSGRIHRG